MRTPPRPPASLQLELWIPDPDSARVFQRFREEIRSLPGRSGAHFDVAPEGSVERQGGPGREGSPAPATEWEAGYRALLSWRAPGDDPKDPPIGIAFSCGPAQGGTVLSIVCRDRGGRARWAETDELVGWIASEIVGPIARSLSSSSAVDDDVDPSAARPGA